MAQFTYNDFIKHNAAPQGADHISVYDNAGNIVGMIPLGSLQVTADTPLYKFGLLSDIHVDTTDYNYSQYINTYPYSDEGQGDFQRAIKWLLDNENVDMFCACGDLSQNGTAAEFAMPQGVISNYLPTSKGVPFYTCTGNHDVKTAGGNGFGTYFLRSFEQTWTGMTNFERSTGFNESFCFDKQAGTNTDHFIFFSMYSYSLGSSASPYNDADITWLRTKLEAWKNDRVFLFTHLFFPDYAGNLGRVNGSGGIYPSGNWLGGSQLTTLTSFLATYKNVLWFSGHSHWKWDLQKYQDNINVQQYGTDGAWTIHVPSCALPIDSDYTNLGSQTESNRVEKPLESQGGVVYVYADRIEIRGIDFNINASQKGDATRGFSGDTYTKYLPIAHYNMSTVLKTIGDIVNPGDPVQGYYIVTSSGKKQGETITKEGDYIILTYNGQSQCVAATNGQLTESDMTMGASVTAEDVKVIYGGQEIPLADVQNYGLYLADASDAGGGEYAPLGDMLTNGVPNASVQSFTCVDSNNENSATRHAVQFNVSSRFLTGNSWCTVLDTDNPLIVKIKGLRINGVLVNTQEGDITSGSTSGDTGITYEMITVPYADINSMAVNSSKEVIMVNPHRSNGYILGYNGSAAVSQGNGFATEQDMITAAYGVKDTDNFHMIISKVQNTREETSTIDHPRTFTVSNGDKATITQDFVKGTSSIAGYDLYSLSQTIDGANKKDKTNNCSVIIDFDGMEFPRTIYIKLYYNSNNGSTSTFTVNGTSATGGTGNTLTSLSNFTAVNITGGVTNGSLAFTNSSQSNKTSVSFTAYVLVPNNIVEQETIVTQVPDGNPYYTLTSKVGTMSPTGTTAAAGWGSTPMHYTIENATSLASSSDLTSGVAASNNPSLIRLKNPSNNYLNAGGELSSLKYATGTGEWSVWYLYDANSGSANVGDYLQQSNFETNTLKRSLNPATNVRNLNNGYVAVTLSATSSGFWVRPTNYVADVQPTLVVEDLKVYPGNMVTAGTETTLPQYIGFFDDSNHTGVDRYQIANGFQPSYVESGSDGRLQFQTSSSYAGGAITIVMKAKFTY